jgi:hypothetical protein
MQIWMSNNSDLSNVQPPKGGVWTGQNGKSFVQKIKNYILYHFNKLQNFVQMSPMLSNGLSNVVCPMVCPMYLGVVF